LAGAIDRPPQQREQERAWLKGNLAADMQALGMFGQRDYHQAGGFIRSLKASEIHLLADLYYRTRSRAEQDLRQQQLPQSQLNPAQPNPPQNNLAQPKPDPAGPNPTADEQQRGKAEREDLDKLCAQLAKGRKPVQLLSELIYASLPGWCVQQSLGPVPSSYYANGSYVGPLFSPEYAGPYADAVYSAHQVSQANTSMRGRGDSINRDGSFANRDGGFASRNGGAMPNRGPTAAAYPGMMPGATVHGPYLPYVPARPIYMPPALPYGTNQGQQRSTR
jgi:hypothetical protein